MRNGYKKWFACGCTSSSSSSSSIKLLLFLIPLILVFLFVAISGPTGTANWGLISSTLTPSSSSLNGSLIPVSHAKESDEVTDLVVEEGINMEELASRDQAEAEAVINRSSSSYSPPAFTVKAINANQGVTKDSGFNNSTNTPPEVPALDEWHAFNKERRGPRPHTSLEKVEVSLQKARAAIQEAKYGNQTQDPDYIPVGPMYWNAKTFHRSYLEMEKNFKVFVYEEGESPVFHHGPTTHMYSLEGNFIYEIEKNWQFRTRDPRRAQVYFLPFSVTRMVQYVYVSNSYDLKPLKRTVMDYVDLIARRYPYWNRSLGADHFMLSCHDWGPETSFSVPYLYKNSIRALCNANTSEKFKPAKDVSIPEIKLLTYHMDLVGGPSPSQRSILAFFAGGNHGPVRPIVFEHWENKDPDIRVHNYLPKGVSYFELLRQAKFCLCPSGYEVASPRIIESIYTGCVPVLISDHYVPPFSDVLNWKTFSVEVPLSEVPNLKTILLSISTRQYLKMQGRVLQMRRHFEFHSPPKRFDVFHMVLHSIWLRRLNVGISEDLREMKG